MRGKDEFSNCGMSHLLKRTVDTYNNIILGRVNSVSSKVWYDGSMASQSVVRWVHGLPKCGTMGPWPPKVWYNGSMALPKCGMMGPWPPKVWYDGSMALPHHVVLLPSITKPSITL